MKVNAPYTSRHTVKQLRSCKSIKSLLMRSASARAAHDDGLVSIGPSKIPWVERLGKVKIVKYSY